MQKYETNIIKLPWLIFKNKNLLSEMIKRNLDSKFKGSALGYIWTFLNPLIMLTIYTFAFSVVFQAKWGMKDEGHFDFALILYASLTIFNFFGDAVRESTSLIVSQPNFVKKVVFPLEILPLASLITSLITLLINLSIFLIVFFIANRYISSTIYLLPIVILPVCFLVLGIIYFMSALCVYIRDLTYLTIHLINILLFTSPVFYSIDKIPVKLKFFLYLNPIAFLLETARDTMVFSKLPDFKFLLLYYFFGFIVLVFGFWFFQKTRKGFADVL